MLKDIRNIFNGIIYGATLIVPGVSATIFAIMLGFYDELIKTINHFREDSRKNIRYLAAFLLGVAIGAVLFSTVLLFFLERYQFQTMALFMGLLAGTIPLIAVKADMSKRKMPIRNVLLTVLFLAELEQQARPQPYVAIFHLIPQVFGFVTTNWLLTIT